MKAINYLILLSVSIFVFSSCTKEVQGPQGSQGKQGPQGSSSSYYSLTDSVPNGAAPMGQWNTWVNGFQHTFTNLTYLSSSQYNIVEVYYSTTNNSQSIWTELPYSNVISSGDNFDFSYSQYTLTIYYTTTTNTPPNSANGNYSYFKIVIITQP